MKPKPQLPIPHCDVYLALCDLFDRYGKNGPSQKHANTVLHEQGYKLDSLTRWLPVFERRLGVGDGTLVNWRKRELTEKGTHLRDHLRDMASRHHAAVARLKGKGRQRVSVGASTTLATLFL